MSKPKDQENCAAKQKQVTKKNCQGKDLIARKKKKKKKLKEKKQTSTQKKKKKNLESRIRKLKVEHVAQ